MDPKQFPMTVEGREYTLAVLCDGGVFCSAEQWPHTLPGRLAAEVRRRLELEAEVDRLRAQLAQRADAPAPVVEPVVEVVDAEPERQPCRWCDAPKPVGRGLTMHEQMCAKNPERRVSSLEQRRNGHSPKAEAPAS